MRARMGGEGDQEGRGRLRELVLLFPELMDHPSPLIPHDMHLVCVRCRDLKYLNTESVQQVYCWGAYVMLHWNDDEL